MWSWWILRLYISKEERSSADRGFLNQGGSLCLQVVLIYLRTAFKIYFNKPEYTKDRRLLLPNDCFLVINIDRQ